ncbi:MAG: methyltransferase domain-containing protein [Chloroflexi bacterium]|nr:methyltransferase domain-containing protein [Chloroflexota bacterium]
MAFGYLPRRVLWKDIAGKVIGCPSLIRRVQAPILMKMLEIKEKDTILDAGCGSGYFTYEIARRCKMCIGVDWISNRELLFVMGKSSKLAYVNGDVQKLPFKDGTFDKILLSSVLQMVEDDGKLLEECHRVLKGNGLLVLSVPTDYLFASLNRLKKELRGKFGARGKGYYSNDEVSQLLQGKGFQVLDWEYGPKRLASIIYESHLLFCYRLGLPLHNPYFFPLLYPIAYFDRFGDKRQKGTELILKARKVD